MLSLINMCDACSPLLQEGLPASTAGSQRSLPPQLPFLRALVVCDAVEQKSFAQKASHLLIETIRSGREGCKEDTKSVIY